MDFFFVLLCLCPDLSVHDGRCCDAAGHGVDLEKLTPGRRPYGVGHLTVLTLIEVICHYLRKLPGKLQMKTKADLHQLPRCNTNQ